MRVDDMTIVLSAITLTGEQVAYALMNKFYECCFRNRLTVNKTKTNFKVVTKKERFPISRIQCVNTDLPIILIYKKDSVVYFVNKSTKRTQSKANIKHILCTNMIDYYQSVDFNSLYSFKTDNKGDCSHIKRPVKNISNCYEFIYEASRFTNENMLLFPNLRIIHDYNTRDRFNDVQCLFTKKEL